MEHRSIMIRAVTAIREFLIPRYRPELYYMRGPGPASRASVFKRAPR